MPCRVPKTYWLPGLIAVVCGIPLSAKAAGPTKLQPVSPERFAQTYKSDIRPLLQKYCISCHQGEKARAGVVLDFAEPTLESMAAQRMLWEKVAENIDLSLMPPADKPQPTEAERQKILEFLATHILVDNCDGEADPGRVTLRRLNRVEYNNTIRDLVGLDFHPADDFPSDDVGYGFDNIGDVLSLPPILLEKYMTAAANVAAKAIICTDAASAPIQAYQPAKLKGKVGSRHGKEGWNLFSTGKVTASHDFPVTADYILRVRAFGQQAGPDACQMALQLGSQEILKTDVKDKSGNPGVFEVQVRVEQGRHDFSAAFLNDYYNKKAPKGEQDRNLVIERMEIQGPIGVPPASYPESHRRIVFCQPEEGGLSKAECTRLIFERFATRAFRRPATKPEVERLVKLVQLVEKEGDSYERGLQVGVQAVLVSPFFLFRVEADAPAGKVREISEYELATRLSYFLWSSMPDEELFRLAGQKQLRQHLDQQVQRMLQDPKSVAFVNNFAGQWLQLRNLDIFTPEAAQFPNFDDELRTAMRTETEMFFTAIVRENRSILEFLNSDFTFLNEKLAKLYGISDVKGEEFRRVTLQTDQRGGLLGQASILTVTSNPTRTSPVKRGKWILENLFASPPPPPPPDIPDLISSGKPLTGTLRQQMEQHRENPACASCHLRMDPLGYGLENYNAIGAWRTKDGKHDIDPSGVLPGGDSFDNPVELKSILKKRQADFRNCLVEKMLTYATGRGLEAPDRCTIQQIASRVAEREDRMQALILEVVHSGPFQKRSSKPRE